ncbi:hypothetical protein GOARA_064_00860 [Gordonia araii NBRC 100433]|uniref:Solute-binding protein family 5 domain-containing protein n=2 Tax=Gordonia araii TaxID=263909 RepID=G7H5F9_9ACTN|nr:ABC transporter substrate-binding protein [Gordonia araii]NNG95798.1 ABC transporter substrate-binding protein [Gordonia araii NBRC 100433]GAB11084.1 hypothetical protein GOARA_064_00860 [Gordonia araii NBRC 100433]
MRHRRALALIVGTVILVAPLAAGCGTDKNAPVHYRTDARLSTYNPASITGSADGVLMALTRVLGGFSVLGPQGQVISDRDVGDVELAPGPTLTVRYTFSPDAVYSDGAKPACDDLVLAWAAQSGKFRGFTPATTAGYRDIERIDCEPGSSTAIARFHKGRSYRDWRGLFGAGSMMPAHIVARDAGVPNVVEPIRKRNQAAIAALAKSWNTGFDLPNGQLDPARFVSSGPYRAESFDAENGLRLVRNEKWWGEPARVPTVFVFGRNTETSARAAAGGFDVVDATVGIEAAPEGAEPAKPQVSPANASLSTEQLVLAQRGVLGSSPARQAFGACVPRDELARSFGYGSQPWNLHVLTPANDLADPINGQFGLRYARPDIARARELAGQRPQGRPGQLRVRVGYLGPDQRRQQMVAAITASCRRAGIDVVDAGGPDIAVAGLGSRFDVLLLNTGASFAAAGAADVARDAFALFGGDPLNIGDFRDRAATDSVAKLSVTTVAGDQLAVSRTMETATWRELAAIPLFATPREQTWSDKLSGVIAGRARNGTGWNMDRWSRS